MRNLIVFRNSERFRDNYTKENRARLIPIKAAENIREFPFFEFFVFLYVLTRNL